MIDEEINMDDADRVQRLERRVQALEDERLVLDTLYAYGHSLDYGMRDEWLDVWTEDAELVWPHWTFNGQAEIARAFDDHSHAPEAYHKHLLIEPRVVLDGDEASVVRY